MGCSSSKDTVPKDMRGSLVWHNRPDVFKDVYEIEATLGEGSMGAVHRVIKRSTGRKYACKSIVLNRISRSMREELLNEIDILTRLDHPSIIRPLETFVEKRQIRLIMEICTGGDLYERRYTEARVIPIMKKVCHAIAYCHSRNVVHRDLKFENIMFESHSPDSEVKLIDFGLSNAFVKGEKMRRAVGTPYTMAPEVYSSHGYSEKADLWGIGVIAFMLLSGELPFDGSDEAEIQAKARKGQLNFDTPRWRRVSDDGKAFIEHCLVVNPMLRWTAQDALHSSWLKTVPDALLSADDAPSIVEAISRFGTYSSFKKAALMVAAHQADSLEIDNLRRAFMAIDTGACLAHFGLPARLLCHSHLRSLPPPPRFRSRKQPTRARSRWRSSTRS